MELYNKKSIFIYLFFFTILVLHSCREEGSIFEVTDEEAGNFFIHPEFVPYLESFIVEANKRGSNISEIEASSKK